jgi:hypothetical protein
MKRMFLAATLAIGASFPTGAHAACRVLNVSFKPTAGLQIAVWLEDKNGNFVDTLFITDAVGRHGLGNRPGIEDFNSALLWPYGRRESALPIWAHRHGVLYPRLVFQDHNDTNLSHPASQGTPEPYYCRPMTQAEADMGTCATAYPGSDKGEFAVDGGPNSHSYYPPRDDYTYNPAITFDSPDVAHFATLNDLDSVSQATPPGDVDFSLQVPMPTDLPDGDYVVWVEAGKEFDQNTSYNFPSPTGIPFADYGFAYRGQPSLVWQVPITIDPTQRSAQVVDYAGYADPSGATGDISLPDATITTNTQGSGSQRLLLSMNATGMYRVAVATQPGDDSIPPDVPTQASAGMIASDSATISFVAPADTAPAGAVKVTAYEIRYRAGTPIDDTTFAQATKFVPDASFIPLAPGMLQNFAIDHLVENTHYYVGIRALDGCLNPGPIAYVDFVTTKAKNGQVDGCFIATAAWGSPLTNDVSMLRRFRDQALRSQALGELAVEAYYTFGPAFAATIEPSDTLRSLARDALAPAVDFAQVITVK